MCEVKEKGEPRMTASLLAKAMGRMWLPIAEMGRVREEQVWERMTGHPVSDVWNQRCPLWGEGSKRNSQSDL